MNALDKLGVYSLTYVLHRKISGVQSHAIFFTYMAMIFSTNWWKNFSQYPISTPACSKIFAVANGYNMSVLCCVQLKTRLLKC